MGKISRKQARDRRHRRLRAKIAGTPEVPRMSVFVSDRHLYVQFIDDISGRTLAAVSTNSAAGREAGHGVANLAAAAAIGKMAADSALSKDIKRVVFDRGGYRYHGRVKAIADAAREAGLEL